MIAEVRELADAATYQQIVDEAFQVCPKATLDGKLTLLLLNAHHICPSPVWTGFFKPAVEMWKLDLVRPVWHDFGRTICVCITRSLSPLRVYVSCGWQALSTEDGVVVAYIWLLKVSVCMMPLLVILIAQRSAIHGCLDSRTTSN